MKTLKLTALFIIYNLTFNISYAQSPVDSVASGCALDFNGTSDYMEASVTLPTLNTFTMEAWINPQQIPSTFLSVPISYGSDNGIVGNGIAFGINAGGLTSSGGNHLTILFSGVNFFDTGYIFPNANEWYYVVVVRVGGTTSAYVNGIQTPNTSAISPKNPTQFRVGSQTGIRYFLGEIDEVRIWNKALTQAEIQQNMCKKLTGTEAGLVGYWRFDDCGGNIATDASGNGNNGTLH